MVTVYHGVHVIMLSTQMVVIFINKMSSFFFLFFLRLWNWCAKLGTLFQKSTDSKARFTLKNEVCLMYQPIAHRAGVSDFAAMSLAVSYICFYSA